jgi:hypothetical protein
MKKQDDVTKLIKDIAATQRDIEHFEFIARRDARKNEIPLSTVERMKAYRARLREEKIPPNRLCPVCGVTKLNSRQWVCIGGVAKCKSCYMKGL